MCLPVGLLKTYNGVGSGITIIISLFGIIVSLVLLLSDKGNIGLLNDSRAIICWAIFGLCLVVLVFGSLAVIGLMKKKKILLCKITKIQIVAYNIVIVSSAFAFFAISVASSIIPFKILKDSCTVSFNSQQQWSQNLQIMSNSANQTFCQVSCPCSINYQAFNQYPLAYQMNVYAYLPYLNLQNPKLPQQFNQCPGYSTNFSAVLQQSYSTLKNIQLNFGCSGWCSSSIIYYFNPLYKFANIPSESCFTALSQYYDGWGVKLLWAIWIIFILILTNAILILCYVFHPQKRTASIYQRLSG